MIPVLIRPQNTRYHTSLSCPELLNLDRVTLVTTEDKAEKTKARCLSEECLASSYYWFLEGILYLGQETK